MATKAVSGPHASRFRVTVCNGAAAHEQQRPQPGAQQEDESGFEVSILNSLPWNRTEPESAGCLANCSTTPDAGSIAEEEGGAGRAEDPTDTLTGAQAEGGCTLTAQLAKSISQLRLSASGSSANIRYLECNCCAVSAASSCCCRQSADAVAQDASDCAPHACDRAAVVCQEDDESQHLGVPWSQNSSGWSKRTCSQRSDATCPSAGSWHQLAEEHRSERVSARSNSSRRRTFEHSLSQHDCQSEKAYQDYLTQLQDRVQLWLSQTENPGLHSDGWDDTEMAAGCAECDANPAGATFFLGSRDL